MEFLKTIKIGMDKLESELSRINDDLNYKLGLPPVSHDKLTWLARRDFTAVDTHAKRFPRENVSSLENLGKGLTSPFPSKTDKTRAIFTWLHHNIGYDTHAYFGKARFSEETKEDVVRSGIAARGKHAELFQALCEHAGLEVVLVNGHARGLSYSKLTKDSPYEWNHAWNAVKLEDEHWVLMDCCRGFEHLNSNRTYQDVLIDKYFMSTPETFRLTHFPEDPKHQFCQNEITWADYVSGVSGPQLFPEFTRMGLSEAMLQPNEGLIQPGFANRFLLEMRCTKDPILPGEQYVILLVVNEGEDYTPFKVNPEGNVWTCEKRGLRSGSTVYAKKLIELDGNSGKGISVQEYLNSKGASVIGFENICKWDVA